MAPALPSQSTWHRRLISCRGYLLGIAAKQIRPQWRAKLAASDVVQQTIIEAAAHYGRFQGGTEQDLRRWLRKVLANNIRDAARRLTAEKRAVGREVPGGRSSLMHKLSGSGRHAPEAVAIGREEYDALDKALLQLPWNYQYVIHLRHEQNMRFAEIAELLGLSENAAQKLWTRAIDSLRSQMSSHQ